MSMTAVPDRTLKLALSCAIGGKSAFQAAHGEFPLWRKSPWKKSEAVSRGRTGSLRSGRPGVEKSSTSRP